MLRLRSLACSLRFSARTLMTGGGGGGGRSGGGGGLRLIVAHQGHVHHSSHRHLSSSTSTSAEVKILEDPHSIGLHGTQQRSAEADERIQATAGYSLMGRKQANEDRFVISTVGPIEVYAVFDGHSGCFAADFVASHLLEHLQANASIDSLEALASETIAQLDKSLYSRLEKASVDFEGPVGSAPSPRTGTTAVLAMIKDNQLVVANTGDSRAVLCRGGATVQLSQDQRPDREDERKRIKAAGGQITWQGVPRVNGSLAMTRAIGAFHMRNFGVIPNPEVRTETLTSQDAFLVLATDGIFDAMNNEEVISCVGYSDTPKHAAEAVCDLALAYGSRDNVTAVVIPLLGWKQPSLAPKFVPLRNLSRPSR